MTEEFKLVHRDMNISHTGGATRVEFLYQGIPVGIAIQMRTQWNVFAVARNFADRTSLGLVNNLEEAESAIRSHLEKLKRESAPYIDVTFISGPFDQLQCGLRNPPKVVQTTTGGGEYHRIDDPDTGTFLGGYAWKVGPKF